MSLTITTMPAEFRPRPDGSGWAPERTPWPVVRATVEPTTWTQENLGGQLYRRLRAEGPVCVIPDLTGLRQGERVGARVFSADHTGLLATKLTTVAEIQDGHLLTLTVEAPTDGPETQRFARELWEGTEWDPSDCEGTAAPSAVPGQPAPPRSASTGASLLSLPRIPGSDLRPWVAGEPSIPTAWREVLSPGTPTAALEVLARAVREMDVREEPELVARSRFAGHTSLAAATYSDELVLMIDGPSPVQLLGEEAISWPDAFMLVTATDVPVILARWAGLGPRMLAPNTTTDLTAAEFAERTSSADAEREPWGAIEIEATATDDHFGFVWTPLSGFYRYETAGNSVRISATSMTGTEVWDEIVRLAAAARAAHAPG